MTSLTTLLNDVLATSGDKNVVALLKQGRDDGYSPADIADVAAAYLLHQHDLPIPR